MTSIPSQLTQTFADVDQSAIAAWWSKLSDLHREEIARLCDTRADTCFFGVVADESELPEVEVACATRTTFGPLKTGHRATSSTCSITLS